MNPKGEAGETDLPALYQAIIETCIQRKASAHRAEVDVWLAVTGVRRLRERVMAFNFWRDVQGNQLSAEYEFVSQASAFHGATDMQIAETLWPNECDGTAGTHERLERRVRKIRSVLHDLKIAVRIDI